MNDAVAIENGARGWRKENGKEVNRINFESGNPNRSTMVVAAYSRQSDRQTDGLVGGRDVVVHHS